MRSLLVLGLLLAACKDAPLASYETYQECFDDLTDNEMREVVDALVRCCIDHAIGDDLPACGASRNDCINYLNDNVSQFDASVVDVQDACTEFESRIDDEPAE